MVTDFGSSATALHSGVRKPHIDHPPDLQRLAFLGVLCHDLRNPRRGHAWATVVRMAHPRHLQQLLWVVVEEEVLLWACLRIVDYSLEVDLEVEVEVEEHVKRLLQTIEEGQEMVKPNDVMRLHQSVSLLQDLILGHVI